MLDLHIFVNAHDVWRSKRSVLKARQSSMDYHEIAWRRSFNLRGQGEVKRR
jgi:hypothetical protein